MAIKDESQGDLSLNNDIRPEIGIDVSQQDVSLGDNNTQLFAAVGDGDTTTGRSMSEMGGEAIGLAFYPETEAAGALGESLVFDGDNQQRVERSFNVAGCPYAVTFSIWIKRLELSEGNRMPVLINTTAAGANVDVFGIEFEGNDRLRIFPQLNYTSDADYIQTQVKFKDLSSWYHIVVGMDTTKELYKDRFKVYINGTRITEFHQYPETPQDAANISTTSHLFSLGQRFAGTKALHAVVGDVKYIDGYQLRADEFGELKYGVWVPKAFNVATGDSLVTSNLTANYDFTNGSMADLSGNNNTATNRGSIPYKEYNYGVMAPSGSTSQSINIPNIVNVYSTTVNIWANMNGTSEPIFTFFKQAYNFIWQRSDGTLQVYWGGIGYITNGEVKISNKWNMITVTAYWSGSLGTVKVYVNGELLAQGTTSTQWSNTYNYYENSIAYSHHTSTPKAGEGFIGEFQVYSTPLTDAQIKQNYSATKHKYAYGIAGVHLPLNNTSTGSIVDDSSLKLHLDASDSSSYGGSGTTWSDLTSNGNDATIYGSPNYLSTNGGYFDLDGSNDYIVFPGSTISHTSDQDFTIETWLKFASVPTSSSHNFIGSTNSGNRSPVNAWFYGTGSGLAISLERYFNSTQYYSSGYNSNVIHPFVADKWYQIVITYNSNGRVVTVYVNGKQEDNSYTLNISNGGQGTTSYDMTIGNYNGTSFNNFDIAQFRIYNDILTAQEVITNYRATQGNYEQLSTVDISGNANSLKENILDLDYTNHNSDSPTENYATLNPNAYYYWLNQQTAQHILSNGNLTFSDPSFYGQMSTSTIAIPDSGKWYFEMTGTNVGATGVGIRPADGDYRGNVEYYVYAAGSANYWPNGGTSAGTWSGLTHSNSSAWTTGTQTISVRVDMDASPPHIYFYRNNSAYADGPITARDNYVVTALTAATGGATMNFGQTEFIYTKPAGYKTLATHNLPNAKFDPRDSEKNENYFKAVTYQGNGGTQGEAYGYKEGSRAAVFNGSSSKLIASGLAQPTGDVSASMWIKFNSISSAQKEFFDWVGNASVPTIRINTYNSNDVRFNIGSGQRYISADSLSVTTGVWYHIACSLDRSANAATLYFNGQALGSTISITGSSADTQGLFIGANLDENRFSDCIIDEVRIFDKALSSTEVGYLADDDTTNIDAISNLVAYYDMEGDADDESGSATTYNGSLSNVTFTQDKPYGNIDVGFAPDFVWIKDRFDGADQHALFDTVRGAPKRIFSSSDSSQSGTANTLTRFDTNGFTLSSSPAVNQNGNDYIAWAWKAGGSYVTDTSGDLDADISANPASGFSIVRPDVQTGVNQSIPHGLDAAPELIFQKTTAATQNWAVYAPSIFPPSTRKFTYLNSNSAFTTGGTGAGTGYMPNSVTDTYIYTPGVAGVSNYDYWFGKPNIMYCFHSVDGFSKIGSYIGNGSTDGPFVYTGFKPAFLLVKGDNTDNWTIYDGARNTNNPVTKNLKPNSTASEAEETGAKYDFLSNGFKAVGAGAGEGQSNKLNNTYIYMAFGDDPFTTSNAVGDFRDATVRYKDQPDIITTAVATENGIEYTKDDGANWTLTQPLGSIRHRALVYDGTYWHTGGAPTSGAAIKYSSDLTNWSTPTAPSNSDIKQLSTDGVKVIGVGDNTSGQNVFTISNVGTPGSWTTTNYNTSAFNNQVFQCGIFGVDNRFILGTNGGGSTKNKIYYTDNYGSSWTNVTLPVSTTIQYITAIGSNYKGEIVAAGRSDNGVVPTAVFSPDNGTTWVDISSQFSGYYIFGDIGYNEELGLWFLMVAYSSMYIYTSKNGVSWTIANTVVSGNQIYTASGSNGRNLYSCSNNGYWKISNDGVTWDSIAAPSTQRVWRVQSDYMPDLGSPIT